MRRLLTIAVTALLLTGCSGGTSPTIPLTVRGTTIQVEWIRTDPGRLNAAVGRRSLTEETGVLVGYAHPRHLHLHSQNSGATFEAAFLDGTGKVVETQTLKVNDEEGITSAKEAQFALIVARGWLFRHNVSVGDAIALPEETRSNPPEPLPVLTIGGVPLRSEVAVTKAERARGLMWRRRLAPEEGMLFCYPLEGAHEFYMLNTFLPLDIAFFDGARRLINVVPMNPYPDPRQDTKERAKPDRATAKYIVEARKGWFKEKGLLDAAGKPAREIFLEMPPPVLERAKEAQ